MVQYPKISKEKYKNEECWGQFPKEFIGKYRHTHFNNFLMVFLDPFCKG